MSNSSSHPLQDRIAIITGASRGIGHAIALHLSSLGARLILCYSTSSTQADLLANQINSSSPQQPRAFAIQADVSSEPSVKSLFDQADSLFSPSKPQILVNCAGILDPNYPSISTTTLHDWENTFSVNARGTFLVCREAANRFPRNTGSRIITLSSSQVASLRPGFGAYTASKAAVEAMTRIMAKELKGTGITVNCVAPGPIATEMFFGGKDEETVRKVVEECPLGRLGETKDVAPVVGFLAGDGGEWINGQVIRVNGGYV